MPRITAPALALVVAALAVPVPGLAGPELCTKEADLSDIAPIDADGDRYPDLAVVCGAPGPQTVGGYVEVWHDRNGEGWEKAAELQPGDNPTEAAAADLDGDGDSDLVVVNQGQHERTIAVFANGGAGRFAEPPVVHSRGGYHTRGVLAHDGDGDGRMDLLLPRGSTPKGALLLRNEGAEGIGPFAERPLLPDHAEAEGITAELSGDARPDLAVPLPRHGQIQLFAGGSDDRLRVILGKAVRRVEAVVGGGDLNGDSVPDLLVTTRKDPYTEQSRIALSDGDRWRLGDPLPDGANPRRGYIRDFTGDGRPEVLLFTRDGLEADPPLAFMINDAGGENEKAEPVPLGDYPGTIAVADVEGDGPHEVLLGHTTEEGHRLRALRLAETGRGGDAEPGADEPATAGTPEPRAADTGKAMVILDASGSMWGRIEERPKIEIAREALDALLDGWEQGIDLGVTAYGHRRKGDCGDIETLVPVGPPDRTAVARAVEGIQPKGKTPLSAAVRHAAEALKYTEERANVILISDGRETCGADPCQVGSELERLGVDFTAHVIGFNVEGPEQAGLRCLAENTGGEFLAVERAAELRAALGRAAERVRKAEAVVTLKAVDRPGGPALRADGLRWTVLPADGGKPILEEGDEATPRLELPPGGYQARVRLGSADAEGTFEVTRGKGSVQELVLGFEAQVEAPEETAAGAPLEARWQGPDKKGDYITVVPANAPEGEYGDYAYTANGNPVRLRAPDEPGEYEVRYLSGQSNTTLARTDLQVTSVEAGLEAPGEVDAGTHIKVHWKGPDHEGDYITMVERDTPEGKWSNYAYTSAGNPVDLRAPDQAGEYELRYLTGQSNKTLARAPITVKASEATVSAPTRVKAGALVKVEWRGPDNEGDYITVVRRDAPEGEYGNYAYTANGSPADLRIPDAPGEYEFRYLTGQSGKTLARQPVTVQAVSAGLDARSEVPAGEPFQVRWQGPDHKGDYVTVVPEDAPDGEYGEYAYTANGNPLTLNAPKEGGAYELRYQTGRSGRVLARRPVTVE